MSIGLLSIEQGGFPKVPAILIHAGLQTAGFPASKDPVKKKLAIEALNVQCLCTVCTMGSDSARLLLQSGLQLCNRLLNVSNWVSKTLEIKEKTNQQLIIEKSHD